MFYLVFYYWHIIISRINRWQNPIGDLDGLWWFLVKIFKLYFVCLFPSSFSPKWIWGKCAHCKIKKKKNSVIVRRINHLINHFNQYLLGLSSQVKLNMFNSIKKSYHEKDKLKEIILIQIFLLLRIFNISLKKKKKKYV